MSGTIGGHHTLDKDAVEALRAAVEEADATAFGSDAIALSPAMAVLTGMEGSTSIIAANENSVGLVIGVPNSTDKNGFLSFGQAAVFDAGISLIAGERPIILLSAVSSLEVFAISEPSGATICWQQFVSSA